MAPRLRRHPWTWVLLAAALVGTAAVLVDAGRRAPGYVPGEATIGLVDTLGRTLPDDPPRVRFTEVAQQAGIDFEHFPCERTNRLPEDMGSGVALGDVDGDGWVDVFLVNTARSLDPARASAEGPGRCALYRNRGDGSFEDTSSTSGADLEVQGMGAAFLDADSDGDLDLLVTSYGGLHFLVNDGSGRFRDATASAGFGGFDGFWTGLAVGDYDRDGAVDAYVCGYVRYSDDPGSESPVFSQYGTSIPVRLNPSAFQPERNLLFHNERDGTFEERAEQSGVGNPHGRSLAAVMTDLSGDGWPDLYVANDVSDNALFVNLGDGTFVDRATQALVADYRGAMGLAMGDFDRDLDLDFHVTHWVGQENALYVNRSRPPDAQCPQGEPLFVDSADRFGLGASTLKEVGWATRFFDFDNDGELDLFAVNGSTIPIAGDTSRLEPERSQLFWNAGSKRGFYSLGALAGAFFSEEHVGRGGATFDFDLDGDQDVLITVHGGRPRLLRNDGGDERPSVLIRLRQPSGNRFALGARILVEAGGRTAFDVSDTQGSYLSQHAVGELAFGLRDAQSIQRIEVTWPDGSLDELRDVPANSLVTWIRGAEPLIAPLAGHEPSAQSRARSIAEQRRFFDLLARADQHRLSGDPAAAAAAYQEALATTPGHADSLYYLGHCLAEVGRADESLARFQELVERHPSECRGWMQIGGALLARHDLDGAQAAFDRAHRINAEDSLPVTKLALVAMQRGDLDRADDLLARALVLNAKSIEATYFRGRLAWIRGDPAKAGEFLAAARVLAASTAAPAQAVLHEGGTASGAAMVARDGAARSDPLQRWRTVLEREADPAGEYGVMSEAAPEPVPANGSG